MFGRTRDRIEAVARQALPWLILIAGYLLSLVAIWRMWDPPSQGGELPLWYGSALLLWIVGYPASLRVVWERAKTDGARTERERRERFDEA